MKNRLLNRYLSPLIVLLAASCTPLMDSTDLAEAIENERNKEQVTLNSAVVYTAKQILSMDEQGSLHTAVAIADGKILALGDLTQVREQLANDGIDASVDEQFQNKIMMPGFIDNHLHPALAGILLPAEFITPFDWQLPGREYKGVHGQQEYLQRLKQLVASRKPADSTTAIITWGYHQYFHGPLGRADIDAISDHPIIVWQRSFHEIIMNTAALNLYGIKEEEFADNPNVDYSRGHFWENGLMAVMPKLQRTVLQPARMKQGMYDGLLHAQSSGITTVCDQGVPLQNLDAEMGLLEQTLKEKDLPLRMLLIGNAKSLSVHGPQKAFEIIEELPQRNSEQLKYLPKQVKLLADGAFYSQLMQMEDGYLDGHHGEWLMTPEELLRTARQYWHADYQLHIHVNGDKGVNVILNTIRELQEEKLRPEHKTVLHHYGYSDPDHAEQLAAMGISVSANPFYLWALGDKYAEKGLGPERAHHITRLGDLERNKVPVSFHSDLPMAPAAPLTLAGVAASRMTAAGNVLAPKEKMSVDAALRAITIEAARAIQQEQIIGSIEVGKLADFTVLEQNPYDLEAQNFRDIEIWGTLLGGKVFPKPEP